MCDSKLRSFIEKEGKDNGVDVVKRRNKVTHTTYRPCGSRNYGEKTATTLEGWGVWSSVLREQPVTVRVGRQREIWRGGQGYRGFS